MSTISAPKVLPPMDAYVQCVDAKAHHLCHCLYALRVRQKTRFIDLQSCCGHYGSFHSVCWI